MVEPVIVKSKTALEQPAAKDNAKDVSSRSSAKLDAKSKTKPGNKTDAASKATKVDKSKDVKTGNDDKTVPQALKDGVNKPKDAATQLPTRTTDLTYKLLSSDLMTLLPLKDKVSGGFLYFLSLLPRALVYVYRKIKKQNPVFLSAQDYISKRFVESRAQICLDNERKLAAFKKCLQALAKDLKQELTAGSKVNEIIVKVLINCFFLPCASGGEQLQLKDEKGIIASLKSLYEELRVYLKNVDPSGKCKEHLDNVAKKIPNLLKSGAKNSTEEKSASTEKMPTKVFTKELVNDIMSNCAKKAAEQSLTNSSENENKSDKADRDDKAGKPDKAVTSEVPHAGANDKSGLPLELDTKSNLNKDQANQAQAGDHTDAANPTANPAVENHGKTTLAQGPNLDQGTTPKSDATKTDSDQTKAEPDETEGSNSFLEAQKKLKKSRASDGSSGNTKTKKTPDNSSTKNSPSVALEPTQDQLPKSPNTDTTSQNPLQTPPVIPKLAAVPKASVKELVDKLIDKLKKCTDFNSLDDVFDELKKLSLSEEDFKTYFPSFETALFDLLTTWHAQQSTVQASKENFFKGLLNFMTLMEKTTLVNQTDFINKLGAKIVELMGLKTKLNQALDPSDDNLVKIIKRVGLLECFCGLDQAASKVLCKVYIKHCQEEKFFALIFMLDCLDQNDRDELSKTSKDVACFASCFKSDLHDAYLDSIGVKKLESTDTKKSNDIKYPKSLMSVGLVKSYSILLNILLDKWEYSENNQFLSKSFVELILEYNEFMDDKVIKDRVTNLDVKQVCVIKKDFDQAVDAYLQTGINPEACPLRFICLFYEYMFPIHGEKLRKAAGATPSLAPKKVAPENMFAIKDDDFHAYCSFNHPYLVTVAKRVLKWKEVRKDEDVQEVLKPLRQMVEYSSVVLSSKFMGVKNSKELDSLLSELVKGLFSVEYGVFRYVVTSKLPTNLSLETLQQKKLEKENKLAELRKAIQEAQEKLKKGTAADEKLKLENEIKTNNIEIQQLEIEKTELENNIDQLQLRSSIDGKLIINNLIKFYDKFISIHSIGILNYANKNPKDNADELVSARKLKKHKFYEKNTDYDKYKTYTMAAGWGLSRFLDSIKGESSIKTDFNNEKDNLTKIGSSLVSRHNFDAIDSIVNSQKQPSEVLEALSDYNTDKTRDTYQGNEW